MNDVTLPEVVELDELLVPDTMTTEEMVRAGGYYYADEAITSINSTNFPITCRGPRKLYLAHFKTAVEDDHVKAVISKMEDKELALVGDLLVLGAHPKYRDLQRQFGIVCIGSSAVILGSLRVLCLAAPFRQRQIFLSDTGRWAETCRFLLVGK